MYILTVLFCIIMGLYIDWASLIAQSVKNLPAMQKTWVQFLGQKNPLEKEMVTYSSILAWEIPLEQQSLVGYCPWGRKRVECN